MLWGTTANLPMIDDRSIANLQYDNWWVPQPQTLADAMNFERIQQLWSSNDEDGTPSCLDDGFAAWQGVNDASPPLESPWAAGSLVQGVPTISLMDSLDESQGDSLSVSDDVGKLFDGCDGRAKAAMAPSLASLPLPIRVAIDPERVESSLAPCAASAAREEVQADALQETKAQRGLLPPPGLILAQAASLPIAMAKEAPEVSPSAALSHSRTQSSQSAMTCLDSLPEPAKGGIAAKASSQASSGDAHPGVTVGPAVVGGTACTRVDWSIEDFRGKLLASMGRPLVSPPFAVQGLPNLRLMVFPDSRETVKNARSRDRKGLYENMVRKGPLHGALKLKADCLEPGRDASVVRLNLLVGAVRRGPFTFDFTERAVAGCDDFGMDWLKQIDKATGNLRVCAEILTIGKSGEGPITHSVRLSESPDDQGVVEDREAFDPPCRTWRRPATKSQPRLRAC